MYHPMTDHASRMLLITPAFFGYEHDIKVALESHGVRVDYYDERPTNSSVAKAVFRLGGWPVGLLIKRYYERILAEASKHTYDALLLIKGEVVPLWFLRELRRSQPTARFIYYSFDAIVPGSNPTELFSEMDDLFSFDPKNVLQFPGLRLKPLFYAPEFSQDGQGGQRPYALSFVGTLHSDRYRFVSRLLQSFGTTYRFFYVPARWFFFITKYVTREFSAVGWGEVSFRKLSKKDVASIFQNSRAVLDIQRSNQSGLTMRTFEVLASGAILVTGNPAIRDADFFDPERIVVVENYDDDDASERLRETLAALNPSDTPLPGLEKYAVGHWVTDFIALP